MAQAVPTLAILHTKVDEDVVSTLRVLLAQAQAGELVGFAYVAMQPAGRYRGDLVGFALQHPVMALGLAKALEEQIVRRLR